MAHGLSTFEKRKSLVLRVDGIGATLRAIDFALDFMGIPCWTDGLAGRAGIASMEGTPAWAVSLLLESPVVNLSCLIGIICPVTGCLTQTLHVSSENYRLSCCCALAHTITWRWNTFRSEHVTEERKPCLCLRRSQSGAILSLQYTMHVLI